MWIYIHVLWMCQNKLFIFDAVCILWNKTVDDNCEFCLYVSGKVVSARYHLFLLTYNDDTSQVLTMTRGGFWLWFNFGVQKPRSNLDLYFLQFPHGNCFSFWPTMMILHKCWSLPKANLCWFWGPKIKVKFGLQTLHRIHTITLLLFDLQ